MEDGVVADGVKSDGTAEGVNAVEAVADEVKPEAAVPEEVKPDGVTVREIDDRVVVLVLPATLPPEQAADLRKTINAQIDAGRRELLVVFEKLTRVDSKLLSMLNQTAFRLSTVQGQLHIVSPTPAVYEQLKAAGSIGSVEFHGSEKAALEVVGVRVD